MLKLILTIFLDYWMLICFAVMMVTLFLSLFCSPVPKRNKP